MVKIEVTLSQGTSQGQIEDMGSNATSESSIDGFANRLLQTGLLIDKYYTPLLCLFGALGNSLSLAIFYCNSKHRSQSSSYYLSALAVSDTGFLLNLFAVWLESVYGGVITSDLMCPLVMYLGQVTCFISIFLMVAFSVERYVAVHSPFSRPSICTRSKAKKVIIAIALVALVTFSYAWVIAKVVKVPTGNYKNQQVRPMNSMDSETSDINDVTSSSTATSTSFDAIDNEKENFPAIIPLSFLNKSSRQYGARDESRVRNLTTNSLHRTRQLETEKFDENVNNAIKLANVERKVGLVRDHFDLNKDSRSHIESYNMEYNGSTLNSENDTRETLKSETLLPHLQNVSATISQSNFTNKNATTNTHYRCSVPKRYHKISEIANYIDMIITLVIPFILITYFNLRIAISVWKLKEQRQQIVASPSPHKPKTLIVEIARNQHASSGANLQTTLATKHVHQIVDDLERKDCQCQLYADHNQPRQISVRFQNTSSSQEAHCSTSFQEHRSRLTVNKNNMETLSAPPSPINHGGILNQERVTAHQPSSEVRVTKTLLLVSTVFLGLNLPLHAIRCTQFIQSVTGTVEGKEFLRALQPWANILFNTNFAVNFLLYCVSGRNFRKSLKHLATRVFKKTPQRTHLPLAAANYQRDHQNRRRWDNRKWEQEDSSSPPDKEQERRTVDGNISNSSTSPTIAAIERDPNATEVIELEDMASNK